MYIGNRIKRVREDAGLTGVDVCQGIVSPSHYSNIENGRFTPTADTIFLLAEKLSVPSSYFLNTHKDTIEMKNFLTSLESQLENSNIENLEYLLKINKNKTKYISSLNHELRFELLLFLIQLKLNKLSEAIDLYENKISRVQIDTLNMSNIDNQYYYRVSGLYCYFKKEYIKSIDFFDKVLLVNETPAVEARVSFNIALAYLKLYQYQDALNYAKKAKNLYLILHKWDKVGDCYNLIGLLLRERKKLVEAEQYIKKGFDIAGENATGLEARLYHNYSLVYRDKKNFKKAIENINKSIQIKSENNYADIFLSYYVKLNTLLRMDNFLEAKDLLSKSFVYIDSNTDKAQYLFIQARINYLLENFFEYEKSIKKSIQISLSENDWEDMMIASEHYSIYLENNNKYKKALEYRKIHTMALKRIYEEG